MPTDGERLATLEAEMRELRNDVRERIVEEQRTRDRLHKLEGIAGTLVDEMKIARRQEKDQYRRLEVRLQAFTAVVAVAGIVGPLIYAGVGH